MLHHDYRARSGLPGVKDSPLATLLMGAINVTGTESTFNEMYCANPYYMTTAQHCKPGAQCNVDSTDGTIPSKRGKFAAVGLKERAVFMYGGQVTTGGANVQTVLDDAYMYTSPFEDIFQTCLEEANGSSGSLDESQKSYVSVCLELMLVETGFVSSWSVYFLALTSCQNNPSTSIPYSNKQIF